MPSLKKMWMVHYFKVSYVNHLSMNCKGFQGGLTLFMVRAVSKMTVLSASK